MVLHLLSAPPAMRAVGRGLGLQIWAGGCEADPWDPSLF